MKIGNIEVGMVVVVDKTSRVVAGFSDASVINTEGYRFLFENKLGDIRFIPLEDGTVQAVAISEGVALPVGNMNSEQFIKASMPKPDPAAEQNDISKDEEQVEDTVSTCEDVKE